MKGENMNVTMRFFVIFVLALFGLTSCANGEGGAIEGGYTPPGIPIRISINSAGDINLGMSNSWATPYGTFDLGYGGSVLSLRDQYTARLLIVRVDNQATVYELEEGKEFHVEFDDDNKLYRRVALNYESDGDIVLELESVQSGQGDTSGGGGNPSSSNSTVTSCPGAPAQRVQVGGKAYVCTQNDRLIVRKNPNRSASEIIRIYPGTVMTIVKGPVCADDWSWWRIKTDDGIVGWVSEGGDNVDSYFICPQ